jgi:hypothetical protein
MDDKRKKEIEMIREAIGGAEVAIEIIEEWFTNATPPYTEEEIDYHHIHDHLNWATHIMIQKLKGMGWNG